MSKSETYRQTLEPVNLVYSKPVAKGQTNKKEFAGVYSDKKKKPSVVSGEILQKSIHSYRLWFRFLKLALELDQQGTVLIMREENTWKGKLRERITKKVVVDRSKYDGWDLGEVLERSFDDWWFGRSGCNGHRHLFVDEVSKVITENDSISNDPNHLTIQIDTRRRLVDVIQDIRDMNEKEKIFNHTTRDKFSINGRIRHLTIQNRYNALILILEHELSSKEILTHPNKYIRPTDERNKDGYKVQNPIDDSNLALDLQGKDLKGKDVPKYSSTINDLMSGNAKSFGAKQILMSVCDGYFLKHPTKTYLE
jgi:hypothetical protein